MPSQILKENAITIPFNAVTKKENERVASYNE
jgi:hypothetical protein